MKIGFHAIALISFTLAAASMARSQAMPTARQPLEISVFGAATGTWTGLSGGRNLGITAGLDVGWKPFHGFYPTLELRGTYPIDDGQVDAQENVLYGFKAARYYGRLHPYANFLVGRDKIVYQNGGYPNASYTLLYLDSVSNIFSYGGGIDLALTDQLALKVDAQFQQIGVPVTASGHIFAKPVSVGIVYTFNFNHRIRYDAEGQMKGYRPPPPPPQRTPLPPPPPDHYTPNSPTPDAQPETYTPPSADTAPSKPSPDTPAPNASTPQPQ